MKGGFFNNKKGLGMPNRTAVDAKKAEPGTTAQWTPALLDKMVVVFQNTLKGKALGDLERRVREGTGAEDNARHLGCGNANSAPLVEKEEKRQREKEAREQAEREKNFVKPCNPTPGDANINKADPENPWGMPGVPGVPFLMHKCSDDKCDGVDCKDENGREVCGDDCAPGCTHGVDQVEDTAAKTIDMFLTKNALRELVPLVMENTSKIFDRVVARGKDDDQTMDKATAQQVRKDILQEALIREIVLRVKRAAHHTNLARSTDGGMLATPAGYKGELNSLTPEAISGLMNEGVGVIDNWLGGQEHAKRCFKDLELLEFEGKMCEMDMQKLHRIRSDKIAWVSLDDLDRETHGGLRKLCEKLISIPFELNKKCSLSLQAAGIFQLAYYSAEQSYYSRHMDGGYDKQDSGRKITAIYYPNYKSRTEKDGGNLVVYKRRKNPYQIKDGDDQQPPEDEIERVIEPKGDRLVLLRARDVPHEVMENNKKRFSVSLYCPGPAGPGDKPDLRGRTIN